jgi:hypothetical protein
MRMPDLIPYGEIPAGPLPGPGMSANPGTALEIERMRQRMDRMEARLNARDGAPASPPNSPPAGLLAGRFLAAMSGMATAALLLIAGSLVWQQMYPAPQAQPTVVVNTPPAVVQAPTQAFHSGPAQMPMQASAQMPSFRPPGIVLPPRPMPRNYFPRG